MNPHEVHPRANEELAEAFHFYESQQQGLGDHFLDEVDAQLAIMEADPFQSAPCLELPGFRYRTVHRFPFSIFFQIVEHRVWIVAIAHHARRPGYWFDRTNDPP